MSAPLRVRLDEVVHAEFPDGQDLEVSEALELHLWRVGAQLGEAFELPARFLRERSGLELIALEGPERLLFPHVDPCALPMDLVPWLSHSDASIRMGARALQDRTLTAALAAPFVHDIDRQHPSFLEVVSHANQLLHTDDTDAAAHYLEAHRSHLGRTAAKGAVIPRSTVLLAACVVLDRLGTPESGTALEMPVHRMRRRLARQAFQVTVGAVPTEEFAATLGLAAVSDWSSSG